jgi:hypothetical protein
VVELVVVRNLRAKTLVLGARLALGQFIDGD